jgi:hypothetical protein
MGKFHALWTKGNIGVDCPLKKLRFGELEEHADTLAEQA